MQPAISEERLKAPPMPMVKAVMAVTGFLGRLRRALTPAPLALVEMTSGGFIVCCAILTATRLGVAEALRDGPRTAQDVARSLKLNEDALYRVLRALAHAGVLEHRTDGRFALNAISEQLLPETPGSMRDILLLGSERWHHHLWAALTDVVTNGLPAHEAVLGKPLFAHLEQDAEANAVFNRAMIAYSARSAVAVVAAHDFGNATNLVDVGGGYGQLLTVALRAHPKLRGVLFDLPHVTSGARGTLEAAGVLGRAEVVAGDFFAGVPAGGDVYVLMNVLHDWSDERAIAILKRCREAMGPHGKLLVVEMVIPEDGTPHFGAIFDLEMLVLFQGGRERTASEFRSLFRAAGLSLTRIAPTPSPASILEACSERVGP